MWRTGARLRAVDKPGLVDHIARYDAERAKRARSLLSSSFDLDHLIVASDKMDTALRQSEQVIAIVNDYANAYFLEIDFLSRFDAYLAVIPVERFDIYAVPAQETIAISTGALRALRFAAHFHSINDLLSELDQHLATVETGASSRNQELVATLYSEFQACLGLSMLFSAKLPELTNEIPRRHLRASDLFFLNSLVFVLSHEYSHIELSRSQRIDGDGNLVRHSWIAETISANLAEEYCADAMAINNLPLNMQAAAALAATSFFTLNAYADYLLYRPNGTHPSALNRVCALLPIMVEKGLMRHDQMTGLLSRLERLENYKRELSSTTQGERLKSGIEFGQTYDAKKLESAVNALGRLVELLQGRNLV